MPTKQSFVQHGIIHIGVQPPLSSWIQTKLVIGQPNDKYEQEADRMADQVMRMPEPVTPLGKRGIRQGWQPPALQRTCSKCQDEARQQPEEEEETLRIKPTLGSVIAAPAAAGLQRPISVSQGDGQPLSGADRAYFEPRFGYDFSQVRVHSDRPANVLARLLGARAFTYGNGVWFGENELRSDSTTGRRLLAHELGHIVQQARPGYSPILRRRCSPPRGNFQLTANRGLGEAIRNALAADTRPVPDPTNLQRMIQRPRIDAAQAIAILNSSNCFRWNARTVEATYFGGRSPGLQVRAFDPRREPATPSEFIPGRAGRAPRIQVGYSTLADAVQGLVHEVIHATPQRRRFQGSLADTRRRRRGRPLPRFSMERRASGAGAVTLAERRGIREESLTRDREDEVLEEIRVSRAWRIHTGGATPTPVRYQPEEVRGSFATGLPKLTYQELYIVGEMQRRYRYALRGANEDDARSAARGMVSEGFPSVRPGNESDFLITASEALPQTHESWGWPRLIKSESLDSGYNRRSGERTRSPSVNRGH